MNHLDHAIQIALEAHDGQMDKMGRPFFEHCRRIALLIPGDDARTVAYLHDVVEKGRGWTLDRLKNEGFPSTIVSAVDALTRRPEETREHFVRRAAANPLAVAVKQADLPCLSFGGFLGIADDYYPLPWERTRSPVRRTTATSMTTAGIAPAKHDQRLLWPAALSDVRGVRKAPRGPLPRAVYSAK